MDPLSSEQASRRATRAARFGMPTNDTKEEQAARPVISGRLLERARGLEASEKIRECGLHIFGVDMLDSKDVMRWMREWGPSWVEWVNDSSCNIIFEDHESTVRAWRGVERGEEIPVGGMHGEQVRDGQMEKWRKAKAVEKKGNWIPVWVRVAGEKDVRGARPNPDSKWSRSVQRRIGEGKRLRRAGGVDVSEVTKRKAEDVMEVEGLDMALGEIIKKRRDKSRRSLGTIGSRDKGLGVSVKRDAIAKARARKIGKMDLDRPLGL